MRGLETAMIMNLTFNRYEILTYALKLGMVAHTLGDSEESTPVIAGLLATYMAMTKDCEIVTNHNAVHDLFVEHYTKHRQDGSVDGTFYPEDCPQAYVPEDFIIKLAEHCAIIDDREYHRLGKLMTEDPLGLFNKES